MKEAVLGPPRMRMFDGESELFEQVAVTSEVYGEYGCGLSTKWVLANTSARVLSVDTSAVWVADVLSALDTVELKRATISHVDLGSLGDWGWPNDYSAANRFHEYTDRIWEQSLSPDTVLIDGRFRVCCFLTSIRRAAPGTRIIFDDYVDRPRYHVVEKFIQRKQVHGRQCLFVVPGVGEMDTGAIDRDIERFRYVMD